MNLDNRYYDALKWLVLIFLPALAVLASGLVKSKILCKNM